jgi:general nucleoside transport system permease protein
VTVMNPPRQRRLRPRLDREKLILALAAPLLALVTAVTITSAVMSATGQNPFNAYQVMLDFGIKSDSQVWIINKAIPYYLAAVAVAIGFRMNLFNIGVDGQYRVSAFFAAVVGGALSLPGVIQIPIIILTAMACGAIWAGLAGYLKATRGVNEVITTIMMNFLAGALIGYFLQADRLGELDGNIIHTPDIPGSSFFFEFPTSPDPVYGTIVIAAVVGVGYWLVLGHTRFGFDLRAVGRSQPAAEASGVSGKRTIVTSMLLSGAVAGLVGIPTLLNESGTYGSDFFPEGIGFTGIAIALLGRNHVVGMGLAALLWCFLERTGSELEGEEYPPEIVDVMQGIIVLSVIIAYEVVRRWGLRRQQRLVGSADAGPNAPAAPGPNGGDDPATPAAIPPQPGGDVASDEASETAKSVARPHGAGDPPARREKRDPAAASDVDDGDARGAERAAQPDAQAAPTTPDPRPKAGEAAPDGTDGGDARGAAIPAQPESADAESPARPEPGPAQPAAGDRERRDGNDDSAEVSA